MKNEEKYLKIMYYQKYNPKNESRYTPKQSVILTPPDKTVMIVVAFLVTIGIISIFSASAPKCMELGQNPAKFALFQIFFLMLGVIGMKFFINYDYKNLVVWTMPITITVVVALILVAFTPLGVTVNESRRWLNIGFTNLQPSEFAKLAVVLLMASAFNKNSKIFDQNKWIYFIPVLIMVGLIYKQPNLSMVILLFMTSLIVWLSSGGPLKTVLSLGFASVITLVATITTALNSTILSHFIKPYQLTRITTWLNPEQYALTSGYQIIQALTAFAAGGFWGVGFGNSKQKLYWLPESHTDFIFAVIGEELGWLGCILVIGLFWTLIHRGLIIASRCPDMYGKLLAVGITFSIGFQAFLNISVATSFLPATGVPLPFISYGGSSLMVSLWMIGVLLNISKKRIKKIRVNSNVRFL